MSKKLTKDQKRKKIVAKKRKKKIAYEDKQLMKLIEGGSSILQKAIDSAAMGTNDDGQEQDQEQMVEE